MSAAAPHRARRRDTRERPDRAPLLLTVAAPLLALSRLPSRWLGADPVAVRQIVETKLRLDLRRGSAMQQASGRKAVGLLATCGMLMLFGGVLGIFLAFIDAPALAMGLAQALTLWMLTAVLLTDYADLVLESADDEILGPLPISDRTLLVSQLVHVATYLVLIMASLQLVPLIVGCVTRPPLTWALGLVVCTPLATACSLLGIVLVSQLVVRLAGPARARSVLVSAQVGMTVLLMLGGQLPNLLRGSGVVEALGGLDSPWLLALPPLWFGGLYELLEGGSSPLSTPLALLALAVPLVCLVAAVRFSGARMHGGERDVSAKPRRRPGPFARLGATVVRGPVQRAAHDLTLAITRRDRGFRMRTYPMLFMPLVILIPILRKDMPDDAGPYLGMAVYYCVLFVSVLAWQTRHSDTPEAAWLFEVAPVEHYGDLLVGAVVALATGFLLPWCLGVSVVVVLVAGPSCLPDLALALGMSLGVSLRLSAAALDTVPFSRRFVQSEQSSNFGRAMLSMLLAGLLAGAHAGVTLIPYGRWVAAPLVIWFALGSLRSVRRQRLRPLKLVLPRS